MCSALYKPARLHRVSIRRQLSPIRPRTVATKCEGHPLSSDKWQRVSALTGQRMAWVLLLWIWEIEIRQWKKGSHNRWSICNELMLKGDRPHKFLHLRIESTENQTYLEGLNQLKIYKKMYLCLADHRYVQDRPQYSSVQLKMELWSWKARTKKLKMSKQPAKCSKFTTLLQ